MEELASGWRWTPKEGAWRGYTTDGDVRIRQSRVIFVGFIAGSLVKIGSVRDCNVKVKFTAGATRAPPGRTLVRTILLFGLNVLPLHLKKRGRRMMLSWVSDSEINET
jgi:hypothetical protein